MRLLFRFQFQFQCTEGHNGLRFGENQHFGNFTYSCAEQECSRAVAIHIIHISCSPPPLQVARIIFCSVRKSLYVKDVQNFLIEKRDKNHLYILLSLHRL